MADFNREDADMDDALGDSQFISPMPPDACVHPLDAIGWNEFNAVTQCHRCGQVLDRTPMPSADAMRTAWTTIEACGYRNPEDGCCAHPDNPTPECHAVVCPLNEGDAPSDFESLVKENVRLRRALQFIKRRDHWWSARSIARAALSTDSVKEQ